MEASQTIGFAMCGSFCTFEPVFHGLEALKKRFPDIIPIQSETAFHTDTRFGRAADLTARLEQICGHSVLHTIDQVEPLGPKKLLDLLVIAPCTGNTIGKLAGGIADSAVSLACKAHLRNGRPVVLAVSTNDGLAGNAQNIGQLLNRRNFFFVPFGQDDAEKKPTSLVADMSRIAETVSLALQGKQIQPVLL